jgi:proline dehydrogenase
MASKGSFCAYATHDQDLINDLLEWIRAEKIHSELFEFQVLYGVPMNGRLEELIDKGFKVRVYVPFGPDWYDYSLRRLNENPKIASYVIGNLLKSA